MSDPVADVPAAPTPPTRDELEAAAQAEAAKTEPSLDELIAKKERDKREDGMRRAAACKAELDAVCARYRCALDVEKEMTIGPNGPTKWPRLRVVAL